ncbi:MAG: DMT family transporter [Desulfobacter sp.]|nr:DMT family transporter [Desulfobacter sp.]WDP88030.1 MAG: DMT family transporter [Desulfobacter sp.]
MINQSDQMIQGYVFALAATAIWSGNFIVARGLSTLMPPVSLAFYRWLTAVIVFTPFALKGMIKERKTVARHWRYFGITSFLGITCFNTFIYIAGSTTSAVNLSLISISFPIFVLFLDRILFKARLTPAKLFGIVLVLAGVICLITKADVNTLVDISFAKGDLWMVLAAGIFAVYSILLKKKPLNISLFTLQYTCFVLGLIFLVPFFIWEQRLVTHPLLTRATIPAILYVGIFASLAAFLFWHRAIVIMGPAKSGMVYYTLPLFSMVLGSVFLGESLGLVHLASLVLILSGILLTNQ